MTTDTIPQTVLFPDLFDKPLHARSDQEQASSDGGAILLKAAEHVYGLFKEWVGVQVVSSVRRFVLLLPRATPDLAAWRHVAFALGARAG